jgi:bacterioferritin
MKGNPQVIDKLNALLADELAAINQYMVHSEMCGNWGYNRLHEAIEKRSITEMRHAEKLIERILFFDGQPVVSQLGKITIGTDVQDQLKKDLVAELDAIQKYNEGIRLAVDAADNGTRHMLEEILEDEEEHVDWIEAQLNQIEQMGLERYLVEQID